MDDPRPIIDATDEMFTTPAPGCACSSGTICESTAESARLEKAKPAVTEMLGHPNIDVVIRVLDVAAAEGVVVEALQISAVLDDAVLSRLTGLEAWHRLTREAEAWAHETPA